MENGIYEGGSNQASVPSLKPSEFIAGFVKGKPGNHYRFVPLNQNECHALSMPVAHSMRRVTASKPETRRATPWMPCTMAHVQKATRR